MGFGTDLRSGQGFSSKSVATVALSASDVDAGI